MTTPETLTGSAALIAATAGLLTSLRILTTRKTLASQVAANSREVTELRAVCDAQEKHIKALEKEAEWLKKTQDQHTRQLSECEADRAALRRVLQIIPLPKDEATRD